jgi:hypothetical protein
MNCNFCLKKNVCSRCSKCKVSFYCNEVCQKSDWSEHKVKCNQVENNSTKKIVLVNGTKTSQLKIDEKEYLNFNECIVPKMLGVNIKYKKWKKNKIKPPREIALFLMIDPKTGLADPEWLIECGIVAFGLDNGDLTEELFWDVYSYIFHLMDFYTEPTWNFETICSLKLNPLAFRIYQEEEHEIQKKYINNKTIDLNLLHLNEL